MLPNTLDQEHYLPGEDDDLIVVEVGGWQLGINICFDLRFPDVWGRPIAGGAEGFVSIAAMTGFDYDDLKRVVTPAMLIARSAESGRPLIACNTDDGESWYPSQVIDHRGAITATADAGLTDGLLLGTLEPLPETGWYTVSGSWRPSAGSACFHAGQAAGNRLVTAVQKLARYQIT